MDLVIDLSGSQVRPLLNAFPPPRFYLEEAAIRDALARGVMFNLLDTESGDKCDLWLLTDDPFDQERFSRRRAIDYHGVPLDISTPEDTILKKLDWARQLGGSEKQLADVREIAKAQRASLDVAYIDRWATRLGLADAWRSIRNP